MAIEALPLTPNPKPKPNPLKICFHLGLTLPNLIPIVQSCVSNSLTITSNTTNKLHVLHLSVDGIGSLNGADV